MPETVAELIERIKRALHRRYELDPEGLFDQETSDALAALAELESRFHGKS